MVLDKQNVTTAYPKNKLEFNFFSSPVTVEPRFNEGPRDWQTVFPVKRFRYIKVLFHIFYYMYYWGKENRLLCRGLCYMGVHYIEVPLYVCKLFGQKLMFVTLGNSCGHFLT